MRIIKVTCWEDLFCSSSTSSLTLDRTLSICIPSAIITTVTVTLSARQCHCTDEDTWLMGRKGIDRFHPHQQQKTELLYSAAPAPTQESQGEGQMTYYKLPRTATQEFGLLLLCFDNSSHHITYNNNVLTLFRCCNVIQQPAAQHAAEETKDCCDQFHAAQSTVYTMSHNGQNS